jgi:hypothetical protein
MRRQTEYLLATGYVVCVVIVTIVLHPAVATPSKKAETLFPTKTPTASLDGPLPHHGSLRDMKRGWWIQREERAKRGTQWRESTLFFGLSLQNGNGTGGDEISDVQFYCFVSEVVTPLFPDGLTVLDAYGQYLNHHGVLVKEKSKYMIIFHPDEPAYRNKLDQIWQNYTQQFQQEAVLIASTITDFCFNYECLGTPIPNLQREFESLQAQYNFTLSLLQDMEVRLTQIESDSDGFLDSSWWHVVPIIVVVVVIGSAVVVVAVVYSRRFFGPTAGEHSPLLGPSN